MTLLSLSLLIMPYNARAPDLPQFIMKNRNNLGDFLNPQDAFVFGGAYLPPAATPRTLGHPSASSIAG